MTTIINTHDMNSVLGIGEKVIYIYEGQLCIRDSRYSPHPQQWETIFDMMYKK